MRRDLFHRLMQQVPAIYVSQTPLFALEQSVGALAPGSYLSADKTSKLGFQAVDTHYRMTGGAPETVALVPLAEVPDTFVFQQSEGLGVAFYGALRLRAGRRGFDLFAPEATQAAALDAAIGEGATPTNAGYLFIDPEQLLIALKYIALEAPDGAWTPYHRA